MNISELRVEDGGIYRCTADNNYAKVQYEKSIQIRGDPIVKSMPNLTVIQGETFLKHCPGKFKKKKNEDILRLFS